MAQTQVWSALAGAVVLAGFWLYRINLSMHAVPREALERSPHRLTKREAQEAYERVKETPLDFAKSLPPRLDRRYIVIGGSGPAGIVAHADSEPGLVGGDIVLQLLQRGQSPESIRIVDFQPLVRGDMIKEASACDLVRTDITSPASVKAAFSKPWPVSVADSPLTVFHTAASIRFGERDIILYDRLSRVNVGGTANVLAAAREAGADIFIATSSASVAVTPVTIWQWPWHSVPKGYVQIFTEADFDAPLRPHSQFFANYGYSKAEAERLVCGANEDGFRTGTIRPGNGVYGQKNDVCVGQTIQEGSIVSWTPHIIQNFVNSRNVSLAHLLFEAALARKPMPSCAGRPFVVSDPGPPICFRDFYSLITQLPVTPVTEAYPPPIMLLLLSHAIETYSLALARLPFLKTVFGLKDLSGPLQNLQPAIFSVTAHTIADDSAVRRSVEEGGLGYSGVGTTVDGICEQIVSWNREQEQ
ncbi:hypothetical protein B0T17DRAFT_509658 [Bombardia bombarda]|uniref:3-beta hydroxysteroid dehydrogenase/isomerase domain-containing protein n=1 Tax=Bombardia bombarda TaxID=252184 RepID=A0AA39WME9_9PEZI|nr:hypothetical protein B0T17DRAFT_509658 [Bombardia bombarda]